MGARRRTNNRGYMTLARNGLFLFLLGLLLSFSFTVFGFILHRVVYSRGGLGCGPIADESREKGGTLPPNREMKNMQIRNTSSRLCPRGSPFGDRAQARPGEGNCVCVTDGGLSQAIPDLELNWAKVAWIKVCGVRDTDTTTAPKTVRRQAWGRWRTAGGQWHHQAAGGSDGDAACRGQGQGYPSAVGNLLRVDALGPTGRCHRVLCSDIHPACHSGPALHIMLSLCVSPAPRAAIHADETCMDD